MLFFCFLNLLSLHFYSPVFTFVEFNWNEHYNNIMYYSHKLILYHRTNKYLIKTNYSWRNTRNGFPSLLKVLFRVHHSSVIRFSWALVLIPKVLLICIHYSNVLSLSPFIFILSFFLPSFFFLSFFLLSSYHISFFLLSFLSILTYFFLCVLFWLPPSPSIFSLTKKQCKW